MQPVLRDVSISAMKSHVVRHTEHVIQRLQLSTALHEEWKTYAWLEFCLVPRSSPPQFCVVQCASMKGEGLGDLVMCVTSEGRHIGDGAWPHVCNTLMYFCLWACRWATQSCCSDVTQSCYSDVGLAATTSHKVCMIRHPHVCLPSVYLVCPMKDLEAFPLCVYILQAIKICKLGRSGNKATSIV